MTKSSLYFEKYSSTGNDFIVFDYDQYDFSKLSGEFWNKLCHRQNGIGADGVLIVKRLTERKEDIQMQYFNADGAEEAMCGNGARAVIHFAKKRLKLEKSNNIYLKTKNGTYTANIENNEVELRMTEISQENKIEISDLFKAEKSFYIDTGVSHCVYKVDNVDEVDLLQAAPKVRYDKRFERGTNFNVYQKISDFHLKTRTYERGVEGETLACGTGAVAIAIAAFRDGGTAGTYNLETVGGALKIKLNNDLSEVFLIGPTKQTFAGSFEIGKFCE